MSSCPTSFLPEELKSFQYLTEKQVSALTGRARQALANDRCRVKGFPYYKIGASVRYKLADILAFMESRRVEPEAL